MISSNIPPRFPIPFANAAGGAYVRPIPRASQIGVQDGAASLTDGFPPDTFQPVGSGGVPPFGQDVNGILKQLSQWAQWQATGAPVVYDSAFATAIGGYPKGSRLAAAGGGGVQWYSLVDNNLTDPDSGSSAGWARSGLPYVFGGEGYVVHPSGMIEQWGGVIAGADGSTTVNLATATGHIAFPTACANLTTSNAAGGPPVSFSGGQIVSNSVIKIWQALTSLAPAAGSAAYWRAIGY